MLMTEDNGHAYVIRQSGNDRETVCVVKSGDDNWAGQRNSELIK